MLATVELPDVWPQKVAMWFARADAEFSNKGITAEACHGSDLHIK